MREFLIGEKKKPKLVKKSPSIGEDVATSEPAMEIAQPTRSFKSSASAEPPSRAQAPADRVAVTAAREPAPAPEAPAAVARRPSVVTSSTARAAAPRAHGSRKSRGQRQFVVRYDGAFVGFFEADTDISPREAFIRVAADLGASDDAFDPERLEIYKPMLLRGARPQNGVARIRGKLRRVAAKQS